MRTRAGSRVWDHLHPLHDEAKPVPHDEDAGRRRLLVAGIDQHALSRQERGLHAVAHHGDDAQLVRGRGRIAAHDAVRHLPFGDDALVAADEPGAGAGAHVELLDMQHALVAQRALRRVDAGERIELGRGDAAFLEDRDEAADEIQRQMRLAIAVLVMLIAGAVFHAEGMGDLADREAGAGAKLLELA